MIINLSCRLSEDVGKDYTNFVISIDNTECVETLREGILKVGKKIMNSTFSSLDSSDLTLWKVRKCSKHNETISKITLDMQERKCTCIENLNIADLVSYYWCEQPSKTDTHLIVDSPLLTLE